MSRRGAALSMAWGMAVPLAPSAGAAPPAGHPVGHDAGAAVQARDFDIPAQALGDALQAYTALTLRPTLARTELIAGKTASAVRGRYSDHAALERLLDGTGLSAEGIAGDPGFVLRERPGKAAGIVPMPLGDLDGYPALLQSRVWRALCAHPNTAPGAYRVLLRVRVDASGRLSLAELIGGTGTARRDAALRAALQGLQLDRPPPPGLAQPLLLAIEPHAAAGGPVCAEGA